MGQLLVHLVRAGQSLQAPSEMPDPLGGEDRRPDCPSLRKLGGHFKGRAGGTLQPGQLADPGETCFTSVKIGRNVRREHSEKIGNSPYFSRSPTKPSPTGIRQSAVKGAFMLTLST